MGEKIANIRAYYITVDLYICNNRLGSESDFAQ